MSNWNPSLYLRFEKERTQPSIDLVARISSGKPKDIIDIGCGPGNSTQVLKNRWPDAHITGLDNSPAMIGEAKAKHVGIEWVLKDACDNLSGLGKFDIVFSNAAIQWIADQKTLLKNMFGLLKPDGVLAVQVPCTKHMPVQTELNRLVSSQKWSVRFSTLKSSHYAHTPDYYYNILCGLSNDIELWETDYYHIMDSHDDLVEWYRGTGLRPYLDCLKSEALTVEFLTDFHYAISKAYGSQPDGKVLFPFTRIFFIVKNPLWPLTP